MALTITVNAEKLETEKQIKYNKLVAELVRKKYTKDAEYSLLNKGIADSADCEYVAYREYVATCKTEAKTQLNIS